MHAVGTNLHLAQAPLQLPPLQKPSQAPSPAPKTARPNDISPPGSPCPMPVASPARRAARIAPACANSSCRAAPSSCTRGVEERASGRSIGREVGGYDDLQRCCVLARQVMRHGSAAQHLRPPPLQARLAALPLMFNSRFHRRRRRPAAPAAPHPPAWRRSAAPPPASAAASPPAPCRSSRHGGGGRGMSCKGRLRRCRHAAVRAGCAARGQRSARRRQKGACRGRPEAPQLRHSRCHASLARAVLLHGGVAAVAALEAAPAAHEAQQRRRLLDLSPHLQTIGKKALQTVCNEYDDCSGRWEMVAAPHRARRRAWAERGGQLRRALSSAHDPLTSCMPSSALSSCSPCRWISTSVPCATSRVFSATCEQQGALAAGCERPGAGGGMPRQRCRAAAGSSVLRLVPESRLSWISVHSDVLMIAAAGMAGRRARFIVSAHHQRPPRPRRCLLVLFFARIKHQALIIAEQGRRSGLQGRGGRGRVVHRAAERLGNRRRQMRGTGSLKQGVENVSAKSWHLGRRRWIDAAAAAPFLPL